MANLAIIAVAIAAALATVGKADYSIEPSSVPLNIRKSCTNELSACPMICQQLGPGTTSVNKCDSETLNYECLCGNNVKPNVSECSLTLPFFLCQEWGNQCVQKCNSNACASDCRQKHPCGATDPKKYNATSSASATGATASTTGDPTQIFTGSPGGSNADKTGAAGGAAPVGRAYGIALALAALFAGLSRLSVMQKAGGRVAA